LTELNFRLIETPLRRRGVVVSSNIQKAHGVTA
jgi:hypothetical protein